MYIHNASVIILEWSVWISWAFCSLTTSLCEINTPNCPYSGWKQRRHRVSFVFNHYMSNFYNFMVRILFIVRHLPVCVCAFVSVFEHAGLRGGCVHDVAFGENCVLYVLLCAEEGDRATRHGSGQECATWVGCTIELGSLRVVNGTGITPLHPPCWVMTTTQHYICQVLFTTTVKTCTLWEQTHVIAQIHWDMSEHTAMHMLKCILIWHEHTHNSNMYIF